MNYLAHFHLAGDDPGLLVGALLGDFVKGRPDSTTFRSAARFDQLPKNSREGILLHRRIDASFDQLEEVLQSRKQLQRQHRRLHGIAQDLLFDHLLAKNWSRYHSMGLESYCSGIFSILAEHEKFFGEAAAKFSSRLREYRLLIRYQDAGRLREIARRIASRWRLDAEMDALLASLLDDLPAAEALFQKVYPQMQRVSEQWKQQNVYSMGLAVRNKAGEK